MRFSIFIILLSFTSFSQDDIDSLTFEKDSVISFYHPEPQYPGGIDSLKNFIAKNLEANAFSHIHSEEPKKVYIEFIVEKDGSLSNFAIRKSSGIIEFDQKALDIIKKMPYWIPAEAPKGVFQRMYQIIPITLM